MQFEADELKKQNLSAVILCGGKSRRMGADKALLTLDGETLLQRLERALSPLGEVLLSVREERDYPDCPLKKVTDRYPDCGPMGGLEAALTTASADVLFVTPIDVPLADGEMAMELYAILEREPETDALLVTDGTGRMQYLLGLYRKRIHSLLEHRLKDGGKDALKMRSFLAEIKVRFVEAAELTNGEKKSRSCNTMEEFLALKAEMTQQENDLSALQDSRSSRQEASDIAVDSSKSTVL